MGDVVVKPTIDKDGNASITIKDKEIASAIKKALKNANENGIAVTITLENSQKINCYTVALPKSVIEQLINGKVNFLTINGGANITFDLVALSHINTTASNDVTVTATKRITISLSSESQASTDGRPVYDFKVTSDEKNINTFGNGKLLLTIPYETQRVDGNGKVSKTGRFEQSSNLIGVYLDEQGKLHELLDSYYDNTSKKLIMHTDHLSTYGVAYKNTSSNLTDITNHWAKEEISFVVARGLLTGTNNQFLPDGLISRGEIVAALAKLANADLSIYKTASFTDCPINNPYFGAIEWATQYKLIDGARNGLFAPSSPISRQTMALVLSNYARVMGYTLPSAQKEITFLDQALISSWAKSSVKDLQMAGIVMSKKNGNFDPLTSVTRAETAMMLSRFIQANTSDGWKMNDCGEWMYFKNGQYLTGSRSIDGLTYKFDQYGVTQSLPKEKRYVLYIVRNGDTLRTLAKKHELSVTELAIFNQLKTSDSLLVGDEIRIPKKYIKRVT